MYIINYLYQSFISDWWLLSFFWKEWLKKSSCSSGEPTDTKQNTIEKNFRFLVGHNRWGFELLIHQIITRILSHQIIKRIRILFLLTITVSITIWLLILRHIYFTILAISYKGIELWNFKVQNTIVISRGRGLMRLTPH